MRLTALVTVGIILFVLFAIGMTRLKFRLAYVDGIVATAQVLFIKLRIYPKKKRKYKAKSFRIKRFRKRIKRNIDRADSRAERKRLRAEKKKNKKNKKNNGTENAEGEQGVKKKRDLKPLLRMLLRILKVFIQRFPRYLQVTVSRLVIGVATDDAANTALTYGYVCQSAQYLLTYIELNSNLKQARKAVVSVYPDFTAEKSKLELDVTLSIRVWQVLALGIALALAYLNKGKKSK